MIHLTLAFLSDVSDALDFIFHTREAQTGGVQVGGLHQVLDFTWQHVKLSGAAIGIACAVAVPIGLVLGHAGKGELLAISISNIGRAVPSLALIAFFVAYIGVGFTNVTLALVLLAIPPILTNTYVGVRQVDPEVIDAGRGMGLTAAQVVRRIELPLALSSIFGGIRTSAVNVVATATIAPLAGVLTLGGLHPECERLRCGRPARRRDCRCSARGRGRAGLCDAATRRVAQGPEDRHLSLSG